MTGSAFGLMTAAWTALTAALPGAPTGVTPEVSDARARISWTAAVDNGTAITNYTATAQPGGLTCSAVPPATSCIISGLANGTDYDVTVAATNGDGVGPDSSPAVRVTPVALTISPPGPTVPQRGSQTFTASGGSGVYTWSVLVNNSVGSVINPVTPTTATYTAGSTGGVADTVQLLDSVGAAVATTVAVTTFGIVGGNRTGPPRKPFILTTTGGSGTGLSWSLTTNGSGATINATTGAYTAGPTGNTSDVVRVQDSLNNVATATVTVTAGVSIAPPNPVVAPLGSQTFTPSGGEGPYTWSITTNASGGSINAGTGVYRAGGTPSAVDTVRVTDSLGNIATVNVAVGLGLAINPASPPVPPRGNVQFSAAGGSGAGYTWEVVTNNSGGSISGSGAYVAGATGSVSDVVKVTDTLGNSGTVTVQVSEALSLTIGSSRIRALDKVQLSVSGGSGTGYVWALTADNTGATIDGSGLYTAGRKAGADVVTVTDSLGNPATVTLVVEAAGRVSTGATDDSGCAAGTGAGHWLGTLAVVAGALLILGRRRGQAR